MNANIVRLLQFLALKPEHVSSVAIWPYLHSTFEKNGKLISQHVKAHSLVIVYVEYQSRTCATECAEFVCTESQLAQYDIYVKPSGVSIHF